MDRSADIAAGAATRYIAACVQAAPVAFDLSRTLEKARDLAADAAKTGAQLILFPEAFVSAYPRGSNFGTIIGTRTDGGLTAKRVLKLDAFPTHPPATPGPATPGS